MSDTLQPATRHEKTKLVKIKKQSQLFYGMEVGLSYNCLLKEREKEIKKEAREKRKANTKFSYYVSVIQGRKTSAVVHSYNHALINIRSTFHRTNLAHVLHLNTHDFHILVKCLTTHLYAQTPTFTFLNDQKYKFHDRKYYMSFTLSGLK